MCELQTLLYGGEKLHRGWWFHWLAKYAIPKWQPHIIFCLC